MANRENPFGQVLVALVTPFNADGEVNWADVEKHIDHVVSNGVDGVVVTGTTGETSTLTDQEKVKLVEVGKAVAGDRAKIIMGGPSNETAHAIELAKKSAAVGADGLMVVTPYYNKPTQAGVLTHFRLVADATDLPVIMYDVPGRAGIEIKYDTIVRASQHPNILAVKDAKGDFYEVSRVLNTTDLLYFSGDDGNVLPHMSIGAAGCGFRPIVDWRQVTFCFVAMDQIVVNIGDANISVGDIASVWGDPVDGTPHPDEWADWAGTIGYEIVTRLGHRVVRIPSR